jgi:hypothetical protein
MVDPPSNMKRPSARDNGIEGLVPELHPHSALGCQGPLGPANDAPCGMKALTRYSSNFPPCLMRCPIPSTAAAASAHRSPAARITAGSEINRVIEPNRSRAWCRALSSRSNSSSDFDMFSGRPLTTIWGEAFTNQAPRLFKSEHIFRRVLLLSLAHGPGVHRRCGPAGRAIRLAHHGRRPTPLSRHHVERADDAERSRHGSPALGSKQA